MLVWAVVQKPTTMSALAFARDWDRLILAMIDWRH